MKWSQFAHSTSFFVLFCAVYFSSEADDDHGNSTADTTSSEKSEAALEACPDNKPVHKWPIRPGVHVHVNGLHMLNNSRSSGEISGFTYGARNNSSVASDSASEKDRAVEESEVEKCTVARGTSTTNDIMTSQQQQQQNETMPASTSTKNTTMAACAETIHNNSNNALLFFCIRLSPNIYILFPCISHKVQKAQSNSYPKFQIILFKTATAKKDFLFGAEKQKNTN